MEELLSLKWNNHKNSFFHLLATLRKMSTYTDVTLACDGKLYNVHKIVLSASSDYFRSIFENLSCPNPVIILKDISASNLEALLDYMYIGEVSVRQSNLSTLIQDAECLKLKGLAVPEMEIPVPEMEIPNNADSNKRKLGSPTILRKRLKSNFKDDLPYQHKSLVKIDPVDEPAVSMPSALKSEDILEDVITIKEEDINTVDEYTDVWDFAPNDRSFDSTQDTEEVSKTYGSDQSTFLPDSETKADNSYSETSILEDYPSTASSSKSVGNIWLSSIPAIKYRHCTFCSKKFIGMNDLRRHVRIHTGEKPYPCGICPYRANRKSSLLNHLKLIHQHPPNNSDSSVMP